MVLSIRDRELAKIDLILNGVNEIQRVRELILEIVNEAGLVWVSTAITQQTLIQENHGPCIVSHLLNLSCSQLRLLNEKEVLLGVGELLVDYCIL